MIESTCEAANRREGQRSTSDDRLNRPTHFVRALKLLARNDSLGQLRVDRELGHPPTHARQLARVVDGAEGVELLDALHQRLSRGRVEEVKAEEVVDAERLEEQDDRAEVGSLDLRDRVGLELVVERPLCEQPEALAGADTTGTACSLIGRRSRALQGEAEDATGQQTVPIRLETLKARTGTTMSDSMPVLGL